MSLSLLPQPRWQTITGLVGLYALCLGYQLNATVAYIGVALTVLVFLFQFKSCLPLFKGLWLPRFVLVLAVFIMGYAFWAGHEFPETARLQRTSAWAWIYSLLFPAVAWQFYCQRIHLGRLIVVLVLGLLLRILLHTPWRDIATLFHWPRMGFGLSETVFSPLAGLTCLGWLLLAPRIVQLAGPNIAKAIRWTLWALVFIILLESLVLSQTRGVWLAAAVVYPVALLVRYQTENLREQLFSLKGLAVLLVLLVLAFGFFKFNSASLQNRTQLDAQTLEQAQAPQITNPAARSVSDRLAMWRVGWQLWLQRPVLGYGPGSTEMLMRQSGDLSLNTPIDGQLYYHLHNHYLEILLRFGGVGAVLFAVLPLWLIPRVWRGLQQAWLPRDYALFLLSGWAMAAIFVFFDFQLFKFAWRNASLVWLALNFAACLEKPKLLSVQPSP